MKTGKKRIITFKPTCFSFGPLTQAPKETMQLRDDELEALYLADFKALYHEDCAQSLGVSVRRLQSLSNKPVRKW